MKIKVIAPAKKPEFTETQSCPWAVDNQLDQKR